MIQNLPSESEIIKELCEKSLKHYVKYSWNVLEPMNPFVDNWHVGAICEYLEAVELGQIKRLLVNMPPRMLKSMIITIDYPTWVWIKNPHLKFVGISYADSLSKEHNIKKRDLIKSHWYQQNWGDIVQLKDDVNTQKLFENTKTGTMFSTSIGGTITGKGGNRFLFDDPHNPRQAESDVERQNAVDFFRGTLQTRLNNPKEDAVIVVMQRLHEQDTSGFILGNDLGYEHLCLPMEFEEKTMIWLPVSKKNIELEKGTLLQSKRYDTKAIDSLKKSMGSYSYSGQYQQDPTPKGGGMFKKWWWRYWQPKGMNLPPVAQQVIDKDGNKHTIYIEPVQLPDTLEEHAQSWDMAFKSKAENDEVACHIWAKKGVDRFLIHKDTKRRSFTESVAAVKAISDAYPLTRRKLIEDKANGPAIIDTLCKEIQGIIPINPGADSKETRAESVTPQIESGNVYLPHPMLYPWVDEFVELCAKFPKVAHDDDVDAMAQMLIYWGNKTEVRIRSL